MFLCVSAYTATDTQIHTRILMRIGIEQAGLWCRVVLFLCSAKRRLGRKRSMRTDRAGLPSEKQGEKNKVLMLLSPFGLTGR